MRKRRGLVHCKRDSLLLVSVASFRRYVEQTSVASMIDGSDSKCVACTIHRFVDALVPAITHVISDKLKETV